MKIKINEDGTILLKDVRLSYPHLFTASAAEEGKPKKFSGSFLLDNTTHAAEQQAMKEHLIKLQKEWFKAKIPAANLCFRNGDDKGKPEYEGTWYVAASETMRPQVIGKRREALAEADDIVYAGCYVNVLIKPWKQDNKHGKKINANLLAVQFVREGERFGQGRPDVSEHFEDEEGGETGVDGDGFDD